VPKKDEVSVLFSGGSDSTLVAALMCADFKKVHLLTFCHSGMVQISKTSINVKALKRKFGEEKVTHKYISIEQMYKRLYLDNFSSDLTRFKAYLSACSCYACQLTMHTATINYNLKNGIAQACTGYKREKAHVFFNMSEKGIKQIGSLYENYGMRLLNPVYDIVRTDWQLFDMGITAKRNVKFPYEKIDFSTQHGCRNGIVVNAYLQGYYLPLFGRKNNEALASEYLREKMESAKKIIYILQDSKLLLDKRHRSQGSYNLPVNWRLLRD
jgi:hypothetical protein